MMDNDKALEQDTSKMPTKVLAQGPCPSFSQVTMIAAPNLLSW